MSAGVNRVIARTVSAGHWMHQLELIAYRDGCRYEACRITDCLTRRIVVEPDGTPETQWLRTGELAPIPLSTAPLFTLSTVDCEREIVRAA
jgi:hypothetical protein